MPNRVEQCDLKESKCFQTSPKLEIAKALTWTKQMWLEMHFKNEGISQNPDR